MKVTAIIVEVEAVKASQNQTMKKLEAMQKEIEDVKAIAHKARKNTKLANAARKAIEGELRRWREREHKMQADAASRMLAESKIPMGLSPRNYLIQKLKQPPKKIELRKLENARTSLTNLCCIYHKKRNKMDYGSPCLTCEMQM
ncbi:hypothetical protein LIER_44141 [Lithospermum erythrorhizon]|uniref:Uncharacterized protein n=1 Tax=Lithospermum erythrorhizon TaxID=34254 RepID=A0AAV3QHH6_LITER